MFLSYLENMFRGDKVILHGEDDKFLDDDESVSEYLVKHYGNCEVVDMSLKTTSAGEPCVCISIDYQDEDYVDDIDEDKCNINESEYQKDYDKMEYGHNVY